MRVCEQILPADLRVRVDVADDRDERAVLDRPNRSRLAPEHVGRQRRLRGDDPIEMDGHAHPLSLRDRRLLEELFFVVPLLLRRELCRAGCFSRSSSSSSSSPMNSDTLSFAASRAPLVLPLAPAWVTSSMSSGIPCV